MKYDVAVVGLGAMGSATAWALASGGASVVGFDRFAPPHAIGSTHGNSRIIREAYYEHPLYVPLVRRAYELWGVLERQAGERLWERTGGLMVGPEHGSLVRGATESARTHGIAHEMLDARELATRFPAYRSKEDWVALLETRAGVLFPERCVAAFLQTARAAGADLHMNEAVRRWTISARGVRVETGADTYEADRLVVAAGPWLPQLADLIGERIPLEIERQISHWFAPSAATDRFAPQRCPIGLWETKPDDLFATFPDLGNGVKCGTHHAGSTTTVDEVNRRVSDAENEVARRLLEEVMPGAGGRVIESRVCLYTNAPDRHFIIDWDAGQRVLIVSPCSGHGFKFASAIGEGVAQLIQGGRSQLDLSAFSLKRFH